MFQKSFSSLFQFFEAIKFFLLLASPSPTLRYLPVRRAGFRSITEVLPRILPRYPGDSGACGMFADSCPPTLAYLILL